MGEQQQWWWKYNLWENKTFAVDLSQCVAVSAAHLQCVSLQKRTWHSWLQAGFILIILVYKSRFSKHICHFEFRVKFLCVQTNCLHLIVVLLLSLVPSWLTKVVLKTATDCKLVHTISEATVSKASESLHTHCNHFGHATDSNQSFPRVTVAQWSGDL